MKRWPLRYRLWKRLLEFIGSLAWRYARPPGPEWGISLRINRRHPLWRLNRWAGDHWIAWYMDQVTKR